MSVLLSTVGPLARLARTLLVAATLLQGGTGAARPGLACLHLLLSQGVGWWCAIHLPVAQMDNLAMCYWCRQPMPVDSGMWPAASADTSM
jgi:hypothetical protein